MFDDHYPENIIVIRRGISTDQDIVIRLRELFQDTVNFPFIFKGVIAGHAIGKNDGKEIMVIELEEQVSGI